MGDEIRDQLWPVSSKSVAERGFAKVVEVI
jgi:hypothetical protein